MSSIVDNDDDFVFDDDDDELFSNIDLDGTGVDHREGRPNVPLERHESGRSDQSSTTVSAGSDAAGGDNGEDQFPGFDREAGRNWLYPINYPVRDYQMSIVKKALFSNTLVCLPTGLGKTFIAAVVMYNIYRWYPGGKVVFMAPTRPLVSQQMEACFNIMGIPQDHMTEMIGSDPGKRRLLWQKKRVFFLTPQLVVNDLIGGNCVAEDIKCLVVDEAHKTTGNHSYAQAVRHLSTKHLRFRVLALSATPGYKVNTVQEVITNLLIANVEVRQEDSTDLRPYRNERAMDVIVVPEGDYLKEFKALFLSVLTVYVDRLVRRGAMRSCNPDSVAKYSLLLQRDKWRESASSRDMQRQLRNLIEREFNSAITLYHGYALLKSQGLRSLYNYLCGLDSSGKNHQQQLCHELASVDSYVELMRRLEKHLACDRPNQDVDVATTSRQPDGQPAFTHPKMDKLVDVVVEHFRSFEKQPSRPERLNTSVIVFAEYRDSVGQITHALNNRRPLVRAVSFVGQSKVGTGAMAQRAQRQALDTFRSGVFNTLVCTCVGEEGLDIGEVDLIVCYEAHASAVRLVQRIGRTGRKRDGRVVMLLTQGHEEMVYKKSLSNVVSLNREVGTKLGNYQLYPLNPRLVPRDLDPECLQVNVAQLAFTKKASGKRLSAYPDEFERRRWRDKFELPPEKMRRPPVHQPMLSLGEGVCAGESPPALLSGTGLPLSLVDWVPWQSCYQRSHLVGHTDTTRMLVRGMSGFLSGSGVPAVGHAFPKVTALPAKTTEVQVSKSDNKPGRRGNPATVPSGVVSIRKYFSPSKITTAKGVAGPFTAEEKVATSPCKRGAVGSQQQAKKPGDRDVDGPARALVTVERFFKRQEKPDFFSLPDGHPGKFSFPWTFTPVLEGLPNFRTPPSVSEEELQSFRDMASKEADEPTHLHLNFKVVLSDEDVDGASIEPPTETKEHPLSDSLFVANFKLRLTDESSSEDGDDTAVNGSTSRILSRSVSSQKTSFRINDVILLSDSEDDDGDVNVSDGRAEVSLTSWPAVSGISKLPPEPTKLSSPPAKRCWSQSLGKRDAKSSVEQAPPSTCRNSTALLGDRVANDRIHGGASGVGSVAADDSFLSMSAIMQVMDGTPKRAPASTSICQSRQVDLTSADYEDIQQIFGKEDQDDFDFLEDVGSLRRPTTAGGGKNAAAGRRHVSSGSDSDGDIILPSPVSNVRRGKTLSLIPPRKLVPSGQSRFFATGSGVTEKNKISVSSSSALTTVSKTPGVIIRPAITAAPATTASVGPSGVSYVNFNVETSGLARNSDSARASNTSGSSRFFSVGVSSSIQISDLTRKSCTAGLARTSSLVRTSCDGGDGSAGVVDVDSAVPDYAKMATPNAIVGGFAAIRQSTPNRHHPGTPGPSRTYETAANFSPQVTPVRRPRNPVGLDKDDDDFQVDVLSRHRPSRPPTTCRTRPRVDRAGSSPLPGPSHTRRPFKRKISNRENPRKFLLSQADVTGEDHSVDTDGDSDPEINIYDPSFIDDMQNTEMDNTTEGDRIRYLRSIRSPLVRPGGFKLIPRLARQPSDEELPDVYSQPQQSQQSDSYEQDSFCVDNDCVEYDVTSDETTLTEVACDVQPTSPVALPKRRRIIKKFSSDSDSQ